MLPNITVTNGVTVHLTSTKKKGRDAKEDLLQKVLARQMAFLVMYV